MRRLGELDTLYSTCAAQASTEPSAAPEPPPQLYADIYAHAPVDGGRDLLLSLLCRADARGLGSESVSGARITAQTSAATTLSTTAGAAAGAALATGAAAAATAAAVAAGSHMITALASVRSSYSSSGTPSGTSPGMLSGTSSGSAGGASAWAAGTRAGPSNVPRGDVIDDCVGAGVYEDGCADESLAEAQAEELLGVRGWPDAKSSQATSSQVKSSQLAEAQLEDILGAPAAADRPAASSASSGHPSGAAERGLLAVLGSASFAQLAALESCMARRLTRHVAAQWPTQPSPTPAVPACGALLHWSSGLTLPELVRLVLETRYARAIAPPTNRAIRVREAARKLFASHHEAAIGELLVSAPSHELPLIARALETLRSYRSGPHAEPSPPSSASGAMSRANDALSGLLAVAVDASGPRTLLLAMAEPRLADARPEPLASAQAAMELQVRPLLAAALPPCPTLSRPTFHFIPPCRSPPPPSPACWSHRALSHTSYYPLPSSSYLLPPAT